MPGEFYLNDSDGSGYHYLYENDGTQTVTSPSDNQNLVLNDDGSVELGNVIIPVISGITASSLKDGEVAIDSQNDRICWKDDSGNSFYASGTSL